MSKANDNHLHYMTAKMNVKWECKSANDLCRVNEDVNEFGVYLCHCPRL